MRTNEELIKIAIKTLTKAYAPYSKFNVAAVLELKDGKIIEGVNVENASYGGTICAERSAIVSAISQGYTKDDFVQILILSNNVSPISPCGICRQFLAEFFTTNQKIIMASKTGEVIETDIYELLPKGFFPNNLYEEKI